MADPTPYNDFPVIPLPLNPDALYATLMGGIEPELLEEQSVLEKRYANESEEDCKKRGQRYVEAIEKFKKQYDAYMQQWASLFRKYKRDMNTYFEKYDRLSNQSNEL